MRGEKHDMNSKKVISYENVFFLFFSVYELYNLLNITMFYKYLPQTMTTFFMLAAIGMVILKFVYNTKCGYTEFAWTVVIVLAASMISYLSGYRGIVITFCLIIAAQNMSMDKIVKRYFAISVTVMLITVLSSQIGIIENAVWTSAASGIVRYGFGYIYPTDFVSCVFFLVCAYIYLNREEDFNIVTFGAMIGIAYVTYKFCHTRLDSLCIIFAAFVYVLLKLRQGKALNRILKCASYISIPLFAFCSIYTTMIYDGTNPYMAGLNILLSNRLFYGKQGIQNYGFSLFGQYVAMRGHSVKSENAVGEWFYLDCSYLNIALRYGMICLIVVCALLVFLIYRQYQKGDRVVPALIILIGINSMIAHHLFDGYTNIFLFAVLTNTSFCSEKKMTKLKIPKVCIGSKRIF